MEHQPCYRQGFTASNAGNSPEVTGGLGNKDCGPHNGAWWVTGPGDPGCQYLGWGQDVTIVVPV